MNVPRCVCGWKNCRVYQKAFREAKHPVMDGVIRLRLSRNNPEQAALKSSIDRTLKVVASKRHDWKADSTAGAGEFVKYTLARHHWTEKHITKYLNDPSNYTFSKPFSIHGAKKYLAAVNQRETIKLEADGDLLFLQTPNVPKDAVKGQFMALRIGNSKEQVNITADPSTHSERTTSDHYKVRKPVGKQLSAATTSTARSTALQEQHVLAAKEEENGRLKDQLETMQGQLSFLHDMVRKLQEEHYDVQSVKSGLTGKSGQSSKRPTNNQVTNGNTRKGSAHSRSNHSRNTGPPRKGDVPSDIFLSEVGGEDWNDWYEDDETTVRPYEHEDDETTATFHVPRKLSRRNSNASHMSKATSIVSASKSLKNLPREIELDGDEDDSEDHDSLEEEAFDNRSFASSKHGRAQEDWNNDKRGPASNKQPTRRLSIGQSVSSHSHNKMSSRGSVSSRSSKRRQSLSRVRRTSIGSQSNKSVSWEKESEHGSVAGVYQVNALTMTDPYGEQGTYSGSISNSTSMPHGFGRLEYDRAGRWYEGDWKHGRWTGNGKLSNGDGDFYEGGLKNDHKHGLGVMRFADGRIFEGEYINGQMIEGKMSYQDGSTYEGSWVDGMRHGRGRCVFADHSVYEGDFREGEFFGFGKMGWSDGGWYEGEWWNGEMHGRGKEVRPDGSIRHEGEWSKGQPLRK